MGFGESRRYRLIVRCRGPDGMGDTRLSLDFSCGDLDGRDGGVAARYGQLLGWLLGSRCKVCGFALGLMFGWWTLQVAL
jgi:hypothetical protein